MAPQRRIRVAIVGGGICESSCRACSAPAGDRLTTARSPAMRISRPNSRHRSSCPPARSARRQQGGSHHLRTLERSGRSMARLALGRSSVRQLELPPSGARRILTSFASIDSVDVPIHLYCLYSHLNPDFSSHWAGRDEVLACTCRSPLQRAL
jgi:hypothetical protein